MKNNNLLKVVNHTGITAAEPLWSHVPTTDNNGQRLSDFMILFPKIRNKPQQQIQNVLDQIQEVLEFYRHAVVFADMNLRLNLLWVSVRPVPGICLELPAAIHAASPEARLVAQPPNHH